MDLTPIQKETILRATKERDYCTIAHERTILSLWNKGLMEPTDGFGYRFGAIYKLTKKGKDVQRSLI